MYTCHGTIAEVFAFLSGYYAGLCAHSPKNTQSTEHAQKYWFEFVQWLRLQLPEPHPATWQDVIQLIEHDERQGINVHLLMFRFYREYLTQHQLLRDD